MSLGNSEQGKVDIDQSSMVIMSKNISGNRVIQATNDEYEAQAMNLSTHEVDGGGEKIRPRHVHKELRRFLDIDTLLVDKYPLEGGDFNLLGF
jgi:hypothetical protein